MFPWISLWGPLGVSPYWASIAVGLLLGTFVLAREADREGLDRRTVWDTALAVIPGGVVGGRLFLAADDPAHWFGEPWRFFAPGSGWSSLGAFFGALGGVVLLARRRGVDPWRIADVYAPAFPLGLAFGRMGCLAMGCCHGRPADWPLGVEVPWSVRYYIVGRTPEPLLAVPLHPSPVYDAVWALLTFVLVTQSRAWRTAPGTMFATLLVAYGAGRFLVEFTRGDLERGFLLGTPLSAAQVTSLLLVVAGGLLVWARRRACTPS